MKCVDQKSENYNSVYSMISTSNSGAYLFVAYFSSR